MALTSRPIPVFSSASSSVLTSAILVSGTVPVWGDVGAGPVGVVRGCAKTDPALMAARKATAAIARNIFISLFVILLALRAIRQPVSCACRPFSLPFGDPLTNQVKCLKSAAYTEAKNALFLVEEKWKTVNRLVFPRVGIISINKTKRHVQNRYLKAHFGADAAAYVAEFRE